MRIQFIRHACRIFLVVGFLSAACSYAQRPAQNPMSTNRYSPADLGYELVWADEFDGDALDPKKWEVRGIGPRALGYVTPEAVKVENGFLKLSAYRKDGRIQLGAVGTQGRFMTRYGFFECRAQLQKSAGIWAAFWIQSPEISKGEDPAKFGAEIDIMEYQKHGATRRFHRRLCACVQKEEPAGRTEVAPVEADLRSTIALFHIMLRSDPHHCASFRWRGCYVRRYCFIGVLAFALGAEIALGHA